MSPAEVPLGPRITPAFDTHMNLDMGHTSELSQKAQVIPTEPPGNKVVQPSFPLR